MKNILFFSSNRADLAFIYNLFKLFDKNKKYKLSIILNDHSKVDYNYISKDKTIECVSSVSNSFSSCFFGYNNFNRR